MPQLWVFRMTPVPRCGRFYSKSGTYLGNFRYCCDMCETDNRRTRAVIYLRADRRGLPDIDVQRAHTVRYINARPTWELVDEYVDEAMAKPERGKARDHFDAMWEAWVADEFDVVVVESSDRLAWNNRADHVESGEQLAHRRWEALHETGEAAWDDLGDAEKAGWRPEIAVVIPSVEPDVDSPDKGGCRTSVDGDGWVYMRRPTRTEGLWPTAVERWEMRMDQWGFPQETQWLALQYATYEEGARIPVGVKMSAGPLDLPKLRHASWRKVHAVLGHASPLLHGGTLDPSLQSPRRGRKALSDDELKEFAAEYRAAVKAGIGIYRHLERTHVNLDTRGIESRIRLCRSRGFLGKTEQGRKGEIEEEERTG